MLDVADTPSFSISIDTYNKFQLCDNYHIQRIILESRKNSMSARLIYYL